MHYTSTTVLYKIQEYKELGAAVLQYMQDELYENIEESDASYTSRIAVVVLLENKTRSALTQWRGSYFELKSMSYK